MEVGASVEVVEEVVAVMAEVVEEADTVEAGVVVIAKFPKMENKKSAFADFLFCISLLSLREPRDATYT